MIAALLISTIFLIIVNLIQSSVGLFPKLAKIYPTKIDSNDRVSIWNFDHLYLVEKHNYYRGKSFESRPWLIIKQLDVGIFVKQSRVLNMFPKKFLIPWQDIILIEKRGLLNKQFVFGISHNKNNVYIISKTNLLEGVVK